MPTTYELPLHVPADPLERRHVGEMFLAHGRFLLSLNGDSQPAVEASVEDEPARTAAAAVTYEGDEGEQNLRVLLGEVRSANARRAIRAVADETVQGHTPDSVRIRQLIGLPAGPSDPNNLGGVLASLGFAMRRLRYPRPYRTVWVGDRVGYVMERPIAEKFLELLDDEGNLRPSNA